MSEIYKVDAGMFEWLKDTYRDIHMHPELGNHEYRTTQKIKTFLSDLGIEQIEMPNVPTGAVGIIRGRHPGKTLALRAEIDALPVQEMTDLPYKSGNEGIMHACGHDANTTVMMGVTRAIVETGLADRLEGNLKVIFQPAEEILDGARSVIDAGVLKDPDVDMILMSHVDPDCRVGNILLFHGTSHANSDSFKITMHGAGGHGSRPYQTQDLIAAGSYLVELFQTLIAREIDGRDVGVISVCSFNAGKAENVMPSSARLLGTVRTLDDDVQSRIRKRMKEICDTVSALFHIEIQFDYIVGSPSTVIDEEATGILYEAAAKVLPEENVSYSRPRLGGEDFAFYSRLVPAAVMRLGCTLPDREKWGSTHSSYFKVDEQALPVGVEIFVEAVRRYLVDRNDSAEQ